MRRDAARPALAALLALPLVAGCAGAPRSAGSPSSDAAIASAIVDGEGRPLAEREVVRRMATADVALIGELHGHPVGLALAARLFAAAAREADRAALSLEFLERDQQPAVDAYLAGATDRPEFARRRGGAPLEPGHRAMIDEARARGLPVVAANAPRRHARQARTDGWDALRALPAAERALFDVPAPRAWGGYRDRFASAMGGDAHGTVDDLRVASFFRAQTLWDATMAASVAAALDRGRAPVIHVAGRFHVAHDGGLLQLVRAIRPSIRVFTLVMSEAPADDDRGAADAVAFVGPAPRSHD